MKSDLYKYILQFYNAIGVDIFFSDISCNNTLNNSSNTSINNSNKYNANYVKENNVNTKISVKNKEYYYDTPKLNSIISNNTAINNIIDNNINSMINNNSQIKSNPQLKQLLQEINNIDCLIKHTARNTVVFDGDINSKIMIIGEAPGQEEDIQGIPFVGQSGMLLNNMLQAIGLSRQDVIIANIVFWRPPLNRTPSTDEISLCLPYVKRLIKIINPEVLLLLGGVSNHALLNTMSSMSSLRGSINSVLGIRTVSTYHPAYLLRSSTQKQQAFKDFLLLRKILDKVL